MLSSRRVLNKTRKTSSVRFSLIPLSHRTPAFTIVELLVVIVIIAILATVTLVSYRGIQYNAQQAVLSSGLNQATKALEDYKLTISSNETYPINLTNLTNETNFNLDNSITWTYYVPSITDAAQNTSYCLQGTINNTIKSISSSDSAVQNKPCTENGLVGWWKLNGDANDSSGNNNNGTLNGGVTSTAGQDGVAGHAYSFDGVDDYISVAHDNSLTPSSITISGWIYLNSNAKWMIVSKGWVTGSYYIYSDSSSAATFVIYNSFGVRQDIGSGISLAGVWTHMVGVFDLRLAEQKFYLNGSLRQTRTSPSFYFGDNNRDFLIGKYFSGYFTNGIIDDVRIYNRALSATEILELYNAGAE